MALNDLTPQLRTRLNRMEKWAGVFVFIAIVIVLVAIGYYAYSSAVRKGWNRKKVPYFTLVTSAEGLKIGDPVMLMGFKAGTITDVQPNAPGDYYNVTVRFEIWEPYFGYLWTDSDVRLKAGLLGGKTLEVTKGGQSYTTDALSATYQEKDGRFYMWEDPSKDNPEGQWSEEPVRSDSMGYMLVCYEGADVMNSANTLVSRISDGLPGFLALTNQVAALLEESTRLIVNANGTLTNLQPVVKNVETISTILTNEHGGLGEWVIPAELNAQVVDTVGAVKGTVQTSETNVVMLSQSLNDSLENLADITGNLRQQVQANSYMLSSISTLVLDLDDLIQGLKRNWLLKGSFGPQTNMPPESILVPSLGGGSSNSENGSEKEGGK